MSHIQDARIELDIGINHTAKAWESIARLDVEPSGEGYILAAEGALEDLREVAAWLKEQEAK